MIMNIIQSILTKNPCYKAGKKITVKGLMLHSVGCAQPSAKVFVNRWNSATCQKAVHGFIDGNTGDVYQCLPWNHRGWHGGGSSNNTHIGVEMCEPACLKYSTGAKFTCTDIATAKSVVQRTYDTAVVLFAHLCKLYDLDPLAKGVIVSHNEGHGLGIASGHVDPEHLWNGLNMGYTMDGFRKAVKAAMGEDSAADDKTEKPDAEKVLYRVQVGAFSKKEYANAHLEKVKAAGFDTYLVRINGLYKIQVGAFNKKEYADSMLAKVKAAGFDAFITTNGDTEKGTTATEIKVGSTVKVKNGAKTYTGGNLASYVYERNHKVSQIKGDRAVITFNCTVVAAVRTSDLTIVK